MLTGNKINLPKGVGMYGTLVQRETNTSVMTHIKSV